MHPEHMRINLKKADDEITDSALKKGSGTKPSKDFKRLLDDSEEDQPKSTVNEKEFFEVDEQQNSDKGSKPKPSLFDLSSQTPKPEVEQPPLESPSALFQKMAGRHSREESASEEFPAANLEGIDQKDLSKKGRVPSQFMQERTDLSFVNPLTTTMDNKEIHANVGKVEVVTGINSDLQHLVEKIMDKMVVMQTSGQTDTFISLGKDPQAGIFQGANIILSEFNTANGELNIRFENLTNAAHQLLVLQENQDSLRLALEQKGFVAHIITATTQTETPTFVAESANPQRNREDNPQQDPQQKRQRQQNPREQG